MKYFELTIPAHKKDLPEQDPVMAVVAAKFQKDCTELALVELERQGFNPEHFKNPKVNPATENDLIEYLSKFEANDDSNESVEGEVKFSGVNPPELLEHKKYNRVGFQYVEDTGAFDVNKKKIQHYSLCNIYKKGEIYTVEHGYKDIIMLNTGAHGVEFSTYGEAGVYIMNHLVKLADKTVQSEVESGFAVRAKAHFQGMINHHPFKNKDFINANIKLADQLGVNYNPEEQLNIDLPSDAPEAPEELIEVEGDNDTESKNEVHENVFSDAEIEITGRFPTPEAIFAEEGFEPEDQDFADVRKDQSAFALNVKNWLAGHRETYTDYYTNGFAALTRIDVAIDSKEDALEKILNKSMKEISYHIALLDFAQNFKEPEKKPLIGEDMKSKLDKIADKFINEPDDSMVEKVIDQSVDNAETEELIIIELDDDAITDISTNESDKAINTPALKVDNTLADEVVVENNIDIDIEEDIEEDIDLDTGEITIIDEDLTEYIPVKKTEVSKVAARSLIESLIPELKLQPKKKVAKFKEGVYENVIDEDYHADDSESSTNIKEALVSGMYYQNKKDGTIPRQDKKVFDIGKLIHAMCLEPETVKDRFIVEPKQPRKPTAPQLEAYQKNKATDKAIESVEFWAKFNAEKEEKRLTCCTKEDWDLAENMRKALYSNPDCSKFLSHELGKREVSHFKIDKETGLMLKVRPDLSISTLCLDLKSIELWGNPESEHIQSALRKEIIKRGYHISAAMYNEVGGFEQFAWIFINKTEGYHWSAVVVASEEMLELGALKFNKGKRIISDAINKGEFKPPITRPFIAELTSYDRAELERLRSEQ